MPQTAALVETTPGKFTGDTAPATSGVRVITHTFTETDAASNSAYSTTGVELYVPQVGDMLLDAGFFTLPAFSNGTADIGTFANADGSPDASAGGLFSYSFGTITGALQAASSEQGGNAGIRWLPTPDGPYGLNAQWAEDYYVSPPFLFTQPYPLRLVVSQNGRLNSAAIPDGPGQATAYIVIVSPETV